MQAYSHIKYCSVTVCAENAGNVDHYYLLRNATSFGRSPTFTSSCLSAGSKERLRSSRRETFTKIWEEGEEEEGGGEKEGEGRRRREEEEEGGGGEEEEEGGEGREEMKSGEPTYEL